ncbi:(2Fe-2S)-binding protein [Streptomyces crystallinus]|uniref:(2Fe-2S)-binding protein n=1 Tax=Streptomyces crystallinus TaxID=68191 RepID=A0ABP3QWP4_9ACTN
MDLAALAAVGGFFELRTGPADGAHRPLARLYGGEGGPLKSRVDAVTSALSAPDRRTGASIAHLGLAARLWSIALGSAVLHGELPDLDPEALSWDGGRGAPDDLLLDAGRRALPGTAAQIRESVQDAHLVPLAEAFRRDTRVSRGLLWGNAGSALAGAVREVHRWALREGRPDAARRALELGAELFSHPDLAGTGTLLPGPAFRRRSCCLYYRCPGAGLCGDCVFDRPPVRV